MIYIYIYIYYDQLRALRAHWALVGRALVGHSVPLWASLGPCGPGLPGPGGPGSYGTGLCGPPPWALVGQALVGPLRPYGLQSWGLIPLVSNLGPDWACVLI